METVLVLEDVGVAVTDGIERRSGVDAEREPSRV
jgi:hypothetical protein